MNIPGSQIPKSTTERVLKRNYAMRSAGVEEQAQPNWLQMLGNVATQALQVPKPYQATDISKDVGAAYSGTGAGEAGPPKQDLLGGLGAGLQGILKYAATPEGRQLMSGLISDPYAASELATQAQQEQAEERAAGRQREARALDVVSGLGMQEMRGTQAAESADVEAARRSEELEMGRAFKTGERVGEQEFTSAEKAKQREFARKEAQKTRDIQLQKMKNEAVERNRKLLDAEKKAKSAGLKDTVSLLKAARTEGSVKNYEVVRENMANIEASVSRMLSDPKIKRHAIDQAVIISFNKILDPTSVVRESEYERTPADVSLINRSRAWLQRLKKGGKLTPEDLLEIRDTASGMEVLKRNVANQKVNKYRQMAVDYGLKPDDIAVEFKPIETSLRRFNSTEEADAAGLPRGTEIFVKVRGQYRKAVVE